MSTFDLTDDVCKSTVLLSLSSWPDSGTIHLDVRAAIEAGNMGLRAWSVARADSYSLLVTYDAFDGAGARGFVRGVLVAVCLQHGFSPKAKA